MLDKDEYKRHPKSNIRRDHNSPTKQRKQTPHMVNLIYTIT